MMRVNHDYERGGALAYLAAYDVHQARVFGRCAPSTGIVSFMALAEQVMATEPYASAKRVFWIVDNGSSHRGQAAIDRLTHRFSNAVMVHTPVHASWVNQVEIYFSVIQRKVLSPNDFIELAEVEHRLAEFEKTLQRHRQTLRLEVHPPRPARPTRQDQPTRTLQRRCAPTSCMIRPPKNFRN
ncbi:transposase [Actinophytocola sp.]|uniref:transposase n=1 Tax=Actinophytocola sp. TaxID=1872138 RepID=UPI002ED493AB